MKKKKNDCEYSYKFSGNFNCRHKYRTKELIAMNYKEPQFNNFDRFLAAIGGCGTNCIVNNCSYYMKKLTIFDKIKRFFDD